MNIPCFNHCRDKHDESTFDQICAVISSRARQNSLVYEKTVLRMGHFVTITSLFSTLFDIMKKWTLNILAFQKLEIEVNLSLLLSFVTC